MFNNNNSNNNNNSSNNNDNDNDNNNFKIYKTLLSTFHTNLNLRFMWLKNI